MFKGLTQAEVLNNRAKYGANEWGTSKRHSLLLQITTIIAEPMILILVLCGLIYIFLGDWQESLVLMFSVFFIISITLYQERRTEKALEALRDLASPRALVIRDGQQVRVPGSEVVTHDILLVNEGDRIAADAVVLQSTHLSVDESLLTGESVPVLKKVHPQPENAAIPDAADHGDHHVFAGALVVKGRAVCRVMAIGHETRIGRLGKTLAVLEPEASPLQKQTKKLVKIFATAGISLCALLVVVYGITRGEWLNGFLAGLSFAMSAMPEEIPVVMTIFFAMGAWRLSKVNVLTRRMPAIETLGATTVLCVDKTGTITQNRMSVHALDVEDEILNTSENLDSLPEKFHEVVEYAILASPKDPFDPMEKAMRELGLRALKNTEHLHTDWTLQREYPLSEHLLAMSRVWKSTSSDAFIIAAKGAPEAIADLCHLGEKDLAVLQERIRILSEQGLRVIGVARAKFAGEKFPAIQHDFDFEFLGLLGLADPIRAEVPQAVSECLSAGVRVLMITGDYPGTALSIARQAGITTGNNVLTGAEINALTDEQLQERLKTTNVCARTMPEQKLRIVMMLKKSGEIVGMTGDGVNDAPALKAADIGIAMGERGADVAREAAAMVLLDDNFASIVAAVRGGRLIYENIRKAMLYIFAVHLPIAALALFPVFLGWPLALMPIHILFVEMIIDPACSLVFEREPEEVALMKNRPRRLSEPVISRSMVGAGLFAGSVAAVLVVLFYGIFLKTGRSEFQARSVAFVLLILGNLVLILAHRSFHKSLYKTLKVGNKVFWWVTGLAVLSLICILLSDFMRGLFYLAPLSLLDVVLVIVALMVLGGVTELIHAVRRAKKKAGV